jgi:hypothetical protein
MMKLSLLNHITCTQFVSLRREPESVE